MGAKISSAARKGNKVGAQPRGGALAAAGAKNRQHPRKRRRHSLAEAMGDVMNWATGRRSSLATGEDRYSAYRCRRCHGGGTKRVSVIDLEQMALGPTLCAQCRGCGYDYPEGREVLQLTYEHDFDQNGIIYYIGTQGKTTRFRNPATVRGHWGVKCSRGTLQFVDQTKSSDAIGKAADMCGRAEVDSMSGDHKDSWWVETC